MQSNHTAIILKTHTPYKKMFNEMLTVYKHNTTRRINCCNEGLPNQQYCRSTLQYDFNQPLGFTHLLHGQLDNTHVRQFKPICKQNLIRGRGGTINDETVTDENEKKSHISKLTINHKNFRICFFLTSLFSLPLCTFVSQ